MSLRDLALTSVLLAAAAGCGLDTVGSAPAADGGTSNDAVASPPPPPPSPPTPPPPRCSAGNTCTMALPSGWSPVLYTSAPEVACPATFTAHELVTSPSAGTDACTCACTVSPSDPPSCARGSFTGLVGATGCTTTSMRYTVNGTGCTPLTASGRPSNYAKHAALPLYRGTCTSSVARNEDAVTKTAARLCVPPAECAEDVCTGAVPDFAACIVSDGDVACPAGPFTKKSLVGSATTLTCAGCSTCQNSATCSVPTMRFFNDATCTTEVASRVMNDACNPLASGSSLSEVSRFRYDVTMSNVTCTGTPAATAKVDLATPRTVCCR